MTPEQIVVAFKRSEKPASILIEKETQNAGWRSWIPGAVKSYYQSISSKEMGS